MSGQLPNYRLRGSSDRPMVGQAMGHGINSSQPPRISIAGNRFTLVDSAGNTRPVTSQYIDQRTNQPVVVQATELDIIIVGTNQGLSKVYYEGAFDPTGDANQPPACFSDNGTAPSASAASPQSAQCNVCPHNAWGSRINPQTGQKSKACNDKKKIAVMLAYGNDDMVYQFQIPPASLKAAKALTDWLAGQDFNGQRADVTDIITRVTFESQGVLTFTAAGFYDDATYMKVENLLKTQQDKIDLICGNKDVPISAGAIAAPQPVQQVTYQPQAQPFAQPAPVQQFQPAPMQQPVQQVAQPFVNQPPIQMQVANPQAPPPKARRGRGRPAADAAPNGVQAHPVGQQTPFPQQTATPQPFAQASPQQPVSPPAATPAFLQPQPVQQPQQSFGMVAQPVAADPGLTAQLNEAFNLLPNRQ